MGSPAGGAPLRSQSDDSQGSRTTRPRYPARAGERRRVYMHHQAYTEAPGKAPGRACATRIACEPPQACDWNMALSTRQTRPLQGTRVRLKAAVV